MKLSELKEIIINKHGKEVGKNIESTFGYSIYSSNEEEQKRAVHLDGTLIKFINNPSEEVQLEAVKNNGYALEYIDNPSEEVKIEAIKENPYAIQYISNPSEELQLLALSISHYSLYMHNLSERVMKEAVKGDNFDKACALKYIENDLKEE